MIAWPNTSLPASSGMCANSSALYSSRRWISENISRTALIAFTIALVACIGMLGQKLHVPDQMGQAELNDYIEVAHVFATGTEIVTTHHTRELFAQHVHQHLRTT